MIGRAIFDASGRYRYLLERIWDSSHPCVTFVMLNPSTADAARDDPTIRRCIGFARDWGYGSLLVVNLFAYRATRPQDLWRADDPIGLENDGWVSWAVRRSSLVVAAWGNSGKQGDRAGQVRPLLGSRPICLGFTSLGQPCHPLYLPGGVAPVSFVG